MIAVFLAVFSTFCMGIVYDMFADNMLWAYGISGAVLIVLALVNTLLHIFMKDPRLIWVDADGKELHGTLARRARKEHQMPGKPFVESMKDAFTVPANGLVMYCVSALVAAVGWSYIGAGLMNIQLKYMEKSKQTEQYAILSGISGLTAMIISVIAGKALDYLQKNRIAFGGVELYAQQVMNAVGAVLILIMILYVMLVINRQKIEE